MNAMMTLSWEWSALCYYKPAKKFDPQKKFAQKNLHQPGKKFDPHKKFAQ